MQEYRDLFFDEINSSLEALSGLLVELKEDPASRSAINEIFRVVHTVKGMSATMTYNSIARLCHQLEEALDHYRKNPKPVGHDMQEMLQRVLDALFAIVEQISDSTDEPQACYVLADSMGSELSKVDRLSPMTASSDEDRRPNDRDDRVEIKIEFQKDCTMLGVRAFMATQLLEKSGELISSEPASQEYIENPDLLSAGLRLIFKPQESLAHIHQRLKKISEVKSVEVTVMDSDEKQPNSACLTRSTESKNIKTGLGDPSQRLNEKQRADLSAGKYKLFKIKLMLSDEVINPAEQFFNIINSFNDYLGQVIDSSPDLEQIQRGIKDQQTLLPISEILDQASKAFTPQNQELYQLEFLLLIDGDPKSILDFMQDACELSKVQVDEVKLSENTTRADRIDAPSLSNLEEIKADLTKLSTGDGAAKPSHDVKTSFVRVNVSVLESLMNSVGELVINHNRLQSSLGEIQNTETRSIMQYLHQVTTKIQQQVMSARMVPINQVFSRFPRFIRDIARSLGKLVELEIIGGETEIDRLMIDELNEILTHLIRNAIDHGIETADQREKHGKHSRGNIKLQAYSQGNNVFITISDDGRGIDTENVKQKAIDRGLLSAERADAMHKEEIMNLIFATGFSTADKVSDLSGRGVGMDVVKSRVMSLGGQVSIDSMILQGTSVKLSIPSTISIIQALIISHQGGWYAVPISDIREIIQINRITQVRHLSNCEVMIMHNQTIPLVKLEDYLRIDAGDQNARVVSPNQDTALVLMIRHQEKLVGIIVDSLICQQEVVIKPISNRANQQGLINGATVFGNGRVAMILNIERILELYMTDQKMRYSPWGTERVEDDAWHFILGK